MTLATTSKSRRSSVNTRRPERSAHATTAASATPEREVGKISYEGPDPADVGILARQLEGGGLEVVEEPVEREAAEAVADEVSDLREHPPGDEERRILGMEDRDDPIVLGLALIDEGEDRGRMW